MARWLLLLLTVLATSLTAVEAGAEIPGFVQPGLVVTYSGKVGFPETSISLLTCGLPDCSSTQTIIVTEVKSNTVKGHTVINTYIDCCDSGGNSEAKQGSQTINWTCSENQTCVVDSSLSGIIAQFWVDPTNTTGSIFGPKGETYNKIACFSEIAVQSVTCLNTIGPDTNDNNVSHVQYCSSNPPTKIPQYCYLLASDATGLVQYSDQIFDMTGTLSGNIGRFIYTFQSMVPAQGDGTTIFLQNSSGNVVVWEMSGTNIVGGGNVANPGPSWHLHSIADFYGNGLPDALFQNNDGTIGIWEMNGGTVIANGVVANPGPSWQIVGTGDFNRDGKSDILFQHDDGTIAIWEMNGTTSTDGGVVANPGLSWHVVGTGDFNHDGISDILFQNNDGTIAIWEMDGAAIIGGGLVANPSPSWHVVGTGNFYGNGISDILFRHDSGSIAIWEMNGTAIIGSGVVANPGASWHVVGTGDFDQDGKSDIVFQDDDGTIGIWEMNGGTLIGNGVAANPGPGWHIIRTVF
jgi:hypothetical protein